MSAVCAKITVLVQLIQSRQIGGAELSIISVDMRARKPLGDQLTDNIKELILTEELKPDDKLPSVRSLARELGINPNTIQKAYSELERCGIIMTLPGRGSIVLADKSSLRGEKTEQLSKSLIALAKEAKAAGISEDEFVSSARKAWCGND